MTDDAELTPQFEWKDAERRLDLMEDQARKALQGGWKMTSIIVVQTPEVTLEGLGLVRASSIVQRAPSIVDHFGIKESSHG